ncbi:MAG: hypothetical protein R2867_17460 [Caldilineaceae bacterium]
MVGGMAVRTATVVSTVAPDGTLIGKIHLPENCANLCFGGVKESPLYGGQPVNLRRVRGCRLAQWP